MTGDLFTPAAPPEPTCACRQLGPGYGQCTRADRCQKCGGCPHLGHCTACPTVTEVSP